MSFSPEHDRHRSWLTAEFRRLLAFGGALAHPLGGAAYLGEDGTPDLEAPVHTWITARMTHVYSLGLLAGVPGSRPLAEAALRGLTGPLADREHGGWFEGVGASGDTIGDGSKTSYTHAFVMLAASSATVAGLPGAVRLLDRATAAFLERFWDDEAGMCVDTWDRAWTRLEGYRGINGTMHAVEAMLAVGDCTGDPAWYARSARSCRRLIELAGSNHWRIPEHFDATWTPDLDYHADRPDDQFKPYGATVGHGLEWARLLLHTEAAVAASDSANSGDPADSTDWVGAATALFDRAVADGWATDGEAGFAYTTDWDGIPVVHDRLHWVVAEAIAAAAVLWRRTDEARFAQWYARWWKYADTYLLDRELGSWHHELDRHNHPSSRVWPGKPDLYHAVQATLIPTMPVAGGLAASLARHP